MWTIEDFEASLVARCPTCFTNYGSIADVYAQSSKARCPDCYGTTFEGGFRAKIVRPSIWEANEVDYRDDERGKKQTAQASVQSSSDFRLRTGDFIFRGDGSRWQMRTISTDHLRTGFYTPVTNPKAQIGYNFGICNREDDSGSVAAIVPPTSAELITILNVPGSRAPVDFSSVEVIRGPLLV